LVLLLNYFVNHTIVIHDGKAFIYNKSAANKFALGLLSNTYCVILVL